MERDGGSKKYGGITDREQLGASFSQRWIPEDALAGQAEDYDEFLDHRQRLMAAKIRGCFAEL